MQTIFLLHFCLTEQLPLHGVANHQPNCWWEERSAHYFLKQLLVIYHNAIKSLKTNRRRILIIITVSVTCQTFQTILKFGSVLKIRILLVQLSEELKHLDLTLFKPQQEKYVEIEVNLISTLPQQQTLKQLQTAIVLSWQEITLKQQSILLINWFITRKGDVVRLT